MRVLLPLIAICCVLAGCGEAKRSLPVVGFLQIAPNPMLDAGREGFFTALAEAGFKDGETIHAVVRNAGGELPTLQQMAQDLVSRKAALIGSSTTPALQAAMNATDEIPIVFTAVSSPKVAGAGESDTDHRPNVTGVYVMEPVDRGLELLHEVLPNVKKVGSLYDPGEAFTPLFQEMARKTADRLGLEWIEVQVTTSAEIVTGMQALKARGVEAVMQIPSNLLSIGIAGQVDAARKAGIPLLTVQPGEAEQGAVAALGWDYAKAGYASGKVAARILKGEKPATIPFTAAKDEQLFVNETAARELGIRVPEAVLERADKVIR